ncbi:MAG: hypothetical protein GY699_16465 [Desulfobacteraceae bacterium]|nr:hypothetical protein [Desulfobacteraceae bacterium]
MKISLITVLSVLGVAAAFGIGFLCAILYVVDPACGPEHKLSNRHGIINFTVYPESSPAVKGATGWSDNWYGATHKHYYKSSAEILLEFTSRD